MNRLLAILVCFCVWNQVNSYYITIEFLITKEDSPISVQQSELYESEEFNYDVQDYTITWPEEYSTENDLPLKYYFDDGGEIINEGNTTLCSADLSTEEGTVAAIFAKALGILNDEVCPTQAGELKQTSVFTIDGGNFGDLINNDEPDDDDDSTDLTVTISVGTNVKLQLGILKDSDWEEPDVSDDPDEDNSNNFIPPIEENQN